MGWRGGGGGSDKVRTTLSVTVYLRVTRLPGPTAPATRQLMMHTALRHRPAPPPRLRMRNTLPGVASALVASMSALVIHKYKKEKKQQTKNKVCVGKKTVVLLAAGRRKQ